MKKAVQLGFPETIRLEDEISSLVRELVPLLLSTALFRSTAVFLPVVCVQVFMLLLDSVLYSVSPEKLILAFDANTKFLTYTSSKAIYAVEFSQ